MPCGTAPPVQKEDCHMAGPQLIFLEASGGEVPREGSTPGATQRSPMSTIHQQWRVHRRGSPGRVSPQGGPRVTQHSNRHWKKVPAAVGEGLPTTRDRLGGRQLVDAAPHTLQVPTSRQWYSSPSTPWALVKSVATSTSGLYPYLPPALCTIPQRPDLHLRHVRQYLMM